MAMSRFKSVCVRFLIGVAATCGGISAAVAQIPAAEASQADVKKGGDKASSAERNSGEVPKQISGGVLNGKAISLPKPPYPAAASAVQASGAVSVQVLIDTEGNVESATAVSGHPLLRAAAVQAARNAKFSPTMLMGQPVKVSGIITYNFVGPFSPGAFGFELAFAERSGAFGPNAGPSFLASQLPEDWSAEKGILNSIEFAPIPEEPKTESPKAESPKNEPRKSDSNRYTVIGDRNFSASDRFTAVGSYRSAPGRKLAHQSIAAIRSLQSDTENRLIIDPKAQWHFRLGLRLGQLVAEIEDDNRTAINIGELEQLAGAAPQNVPDSAVSRITELIELYRSGQPGPELRQKILTAAYSLRTLRV
jgi:TonB family protein